MKKTYKLITASIFAASAVFAQQQQIIPCFTDEATKYYFAAHPEEKARYEKEMQEAKFSPEYLSQLANKRGNGQNQVSNSTFTTVDTIPVVFHILHLGGLENVPNSYVYQALAEVNRVHTKTIPDSAGIDVHFKGISGANNYVFQLATIDPNGNCTNGIIRHYDANTNWDQTNPNYSYTWDRTKYLNVYIVKNICSGQPCPGSTSGGIIVGYTYLPGTVPAAYDVVIYNYQFMTGTNARSMAHEFGHWLGLSHTFGMTNSAGGSSCTTANDDKLATNPPTVACTGVTDDTPMYQGAFSTCPASTPNACDPSNTANVQNIMDYSSCPKNFTNGQITRMHNIMNSTTASRSHVISVANKIATGVRNPQVCIPIPYFHPSSRIVCSGATVTFSDSSQNAKTTIYNWNFPGGTFVSGYTATDSMPKVTYATPGTYAVSYTASTTAGGASVTESSCITVVSSTAAYNTAFIEGFETATVPGTDWNVLHIPSSTGVDWTVTNSAAASGSKSIMIDNFSNPPGDTSILVSPTFNLAAIGSPTLKFKMSYQQQATTNVDKLQIYSSIDCGATWASRFGRSGAALQPSTVTGQSTSPFVPTPSQFATYTVNLSPIASSTNAMFRFVFYSDPTAPGNLIYLDDINIYNTLTGIKDIQTEVGLEIYPNPSSGNVNIIFNLVDKHNISVNVVDMLGRVVEANPSQHYPSGESMITIGNKVTYKPGVYFVNIDVDGQHISKKVIIQ